MKIVLSEQVQAKAIDLWQDIRNSKLKFGSFICEVINVHNVYSGLDTRADIIRHFSGVLKASYDTIESYVRTAERFGKAQDEYANVPYSILRNTNPEDDFEMDLLHEAQEKGWTVTKHREEKARRMYEAADEYRDPLPKISFIERNLESLQADYNLPDSVLTRIARVKRDLADIKQELQRIPIESDAIAF